MNTATHLGRTGVPLDHAVSKRCLAGEARADNEHLRVSLKLIHDRDAPIDFKEDVYIGAYSSELRLTKWLSVPNVADTIDPRRRQFYVRGHDVRDAISALRSKMAHDGGRVNGLILWHSHFQLEGPSTFDVETFPALIFDLGIVYTTQTRRTTLYNGEGKIEFVDS